MGKTDHVSISDSLQQIAEQCPEEGTSLGEMLNVLENKGFGILLVFLALPSALPVPAAGYSTPFGIVLFLIGVQMLFGRRVLWLPRWAKKVRLGRKMSMRMTKAGVTFFGKIEHLIKPRMHWIHKGPGRRFLAMLVILMSLLMCLPIPTTNTIPAMVIFLVGISLSEEDGLFGFGAGFVGLLAVSIYVFPIYLLVSFISEYGLIGGFEEITVRMNEWKEAIKAWIKGLL
ncbi:exopolysaccharide biosynthesis protein [Rubellicoccus peritrichatus]|uniref:Exopolysaccharide biosynthesis protein n=1 Tax=Rubellicoccus peritrichatus TaxID=3080537 RepID=A0AAQ3QVX3_9BACT|nr:exopolysaccharide biosynthesis protein [Puniceicoccus sp. CR14]WOO41312.1 exopolysaccharide biosynthesis protein [Puniceicoccus sp. CR14]